MPDPIVAPFGTWRSPLQAADLVAGALGLGYPTTSRYGLTWEEARPEEAGRVAVVASSDGGATITELLPPGMSARTMVHEYGGRAWAIGGPGRDLVVSSNMADQRLWDVTPGRSPRALTPEPSEPRSVRFASPVFSPDGKWVVAVREAHHGPRADSVTNELVAVAVDQPPSEPRVLASGHDFYSSPAWSANGEELAFICWDHPNMPWDATQLWRGRFSAGELDNLALVAGHDESVQQPQWAPDGALLYISDRTGWWNLYRDDVDLAPMEAEFAGPPWAMGGTDYAVMGDGTVVAVWRSSGTQHLGIVEDGRARAWDLPFTSFSHLSAAADDGENGVVCVVGGPDVPPQIVRLSDKDRVEVVRRSRPGTWPKEMTSVGEAFSFATGDGATAYGTYYAPVNAGFRAPPGELPPLIVTSHGGPTSSASHVLNLGFQYWTTRGFAVVDVDYRGSTGYGRPYRNSLYGLWGLADVEDCAVAAQWLADQGKADAGRMVIRGASSSGLTALAALVRYPTFAAGCVAYPTVDLAALAAGTHKFESRYTDRLVPADELDARSPQASGIKVPVLFFHGLDDKVVPPAQSRDMAAAIRREGGHAFLVEVEGEGHGWRRAPTRVRAQEVELAFYAAVLGFEPDGDLSRARADLRDAAKTEGARWLADEPVEA